MKNKLQLISYLLPAIATIFLSSCTQTPDNLELIPKETHLISAIDVYSLAKKGKLEEVKNLNLFKAFRKEVQNEDKATFKMLQSFTENPETSGIDFKRDVFVYYIKEEDKGYAALSTVLLSEKKFTRFFKDLGKKLHKDFELVEDGKIKLAIFKDHAYGWDSDKLLLLSALSYKNRENLDTKIKELFALKKNEQITQNKEFTKFYEKKKDINIWLSSNILDTKIAQLIKHTNGFAIENNYIFGFLDFKKDNINLHSEVLLNEENEKKMKEYKIFQNNFNPQLLTYFPQKNYIVGAASIHPENYFKFLSQGAKYQMMLPKIEQALGFPLEELFKSLKGSFLLSLFDLKKEHLSYTSWGEYFDETLATKMRNKRIDKAGDLNQEDKDALNQGQTIKLTGDNSDYSINIKNVLKKGGTAETAIAKNSRVNWYKGGWTYGKNVPKEKDAIIPQVGFAADLNSDEFIQKLIAKIPETDRIAHENYTEISFPKFSLFLGINQNVFFLTNSESQMQTFLNGGSPSDNLNNTKFASEIKKSPCYSYFNLDYDSYPEDLKNELEGDMTRKTKIILSLWKDLSDNIEIKYIDEKNAEFIYNLKKKGSNSLHTILTTVDEYYEELMTL